MSVSREKWNIINCLENEKLTKMVTLNSNETNLHVISMGLLNIKVILFKLLYTVTKLRKLEN